MKNSVLAHDLETGEISKGGELLSIDEIKSRKRKSRLDPDFVYKTNLKNKTNKTALPHPLASKNLHSPPPSIRINLASEKSSGIRLKSPT